MRHKRTYSLNQLIYEIRNYCGLGKNEYLEQNQTQVQRMWYNMAHVHKFYEMRKQGHVTWSIAITT